ncbi:MAG: hypothetical protein KBC06_01745 [Candidatus Pacebacteria bacterium]|nr:hypothetical protein [Candidatus Paceibacterota bacterium]
MSNGRAGNVYERLFKLWAMICKMVMDGTRDAHKVAEVLQTIVDGVASSKVYLHQLFDGELISVPVVLGTETRKDLVKIFNGGVYGDAGAIHASVAEPKSDAIIYEIVEDGKYADLFGSLGEERRRFTSLFQVALFCRDNSDKLRDNGWSTFFEMERDFVARVDSDGSGRLSMRVYPFSYANVWRAAFMSRLVSLQQ